MITREADYALRVALFLVGAQRTGREVASCAEVAEAMQVPYRFLRKIAKRMVATGLIVSARGRKGGLSLARAPRSLSVLDVINAMGPAGIKLSRCVVRPGACGRAEHCGVHRALSDAQRVLERRLGTLKLSRLA